MVLGTAETLNGAFSQDSANMPGYAIECNTMGTDLKFHGLLAKVVCPPHCERNLQNPVMGASLHPLRSSVCGAALLDGVLSPEAKGELLVTRVPGIPSYTAADTGAVSSVAVTDAIGDAFHVYATDSVDQAQVDVRLLDHSGEVSSRGLLQVNTGSGFGSVCGANLGAADVVCHQLGYEHGTLSNTKCSDFLAGNLCGAVGTPVAMKNLRCKGMENSVQDNPCSWEPADQKCLDHKSDAVIACFDKGLDDAIPEGQLRLVDSDGVPVENGHGRLEVFHDLHWGSVCGESFSPGDAFVACKAMGYDGADVSIHSENNETITEKDLTSSGAETAVVSDVQCNGNEKGILDCPLSIDQDATCKSGRPAVVQCTGNGSPNSAVLGPAVPPPIPLPANFPPKKVLSCSQTVSQLGLDKALPGTTFIVSCPMGCDTACKVSGQSVYSSDSSVCCAAKHSGALGASGGDVMVTVGHGQQHYFGAPAHGIQSQDAAASKSSRSFVVATPTPDVLSRAAKELHLYQRYAGSSALGGMSMVDFL